jgi:hypothetical protein
MRDRSNPLTSFEPSNETPQLAADPNQIIKNRLQCGYRHFLAMIIRLVDMFAENYRQDEKVLPMIYREDVFSLNNLISQD